MSKTNIGKTIANTLIKIFEKNNGYIEYFDGRGIFRNCPHINHKTLDSDHSLYLLIHLGDYYAGIIRIDTGRNFKHNLERVGLNLQSYLEVIEKDYMLFSGNINDYSIAILGPAIDINEEIDSEEAFSLLRSINPDTEFSFPHNSFHFGTIYYKPRHLGLEDESFKTGKCIFKGNLDRLIEKNARETEVWSLYKFLYIKYGFATITLDIPYTKILYNNLHIFEDTYPNTDKNTTTVFQIEALDEGRKIQFPSYDGVYNPEKIDEVRRYIYEFYWNRWKNKHRRQLRKIERQNNRNTAEQSTNQVLELQPSNV